MLRAGGGRSMVARGGGAREQRRAVEHVGAEREGIVPRAPLICDFALALGAVGGCDLALEGAPHEAEGQIPAVRARRQPYRSIRDETPLTLHWERTRERESSDCSLQRLAGSSPGFPRAPSRVMPERESGPVSSSSQPAQVGASAN